MITNNFIISQDLKFLGNGGQFNEQPFLILAPNAALTGNEFIALSRLRQTTTDGTSGILNLKIGSNNSLTSVTGSKDIFAIGVTADGGTADTRSYNITTVMTSTGRIDVIVKDNIDNLYFGDIVVTGFSSTTLSDTKYLTFGHRPAADTLATDGSTGKSLALYYTFNRQELGMTSITGVADRSGNTLTASIIGKGAGDVTSATVTGWTYGPIEGAFRFDGATYANSVTSNLFNPYNSVLTGLSIMTMAKLAATSNSTFLTIGSGTTPIAELCENNGILKAKIGIGSVTATRLEVGKWYHLGITMTSTGSNSGVFVYVNGTSLAFTAITAFTNSTTSRLIIGKDLDLVSSGLTGCVGLTRIFNRSLSGNEILLNYLTSIPSQIYLDNIKIG